MRDYLRRLSRVWPAAVCGLVSRTDGALLAAEDLAAPVGAVVEIEQPDGWIEAEVLGFRDRETLLQPHRPLRGVRRGARVRLVSVSDELAVGPELLGRVIDASGRPLDGLPTPPCQGRRGYHSPPPPATSRRPIARALTTGVRALDGLLTCGVGQRFALLAGAGVGKSSLLGMLARHSTADVVVVGLIGERGREVNEFLERDLGAAGRARSVVVAATSDEPAAVRLRAAHATLAVAEHFRDAGQDVLLLFDSLTRVAHAQREIGMSLGEPMAGRGPSPSVLALLPRIVERTGVSEAGSITAFFSVLVDGEVDSTPDPIGEAVRGLVDGHVVLSRAVAQSGRYPAVDVLTSLSRLMPHLVSAAQRSDAELLRRLLAARREHADLVAIGAYRRGSVPEVDAALALEREVAAFLEQPLDERADERDSAARLRSLASRARSLLAERPTP